MKALVLITLCVLVSACSTPHSPVRLDSQTNFKGISNNSSSDVSNTTVVMIHGMCEKDEDWASDTADNFAKYLGITQSAKKNDLLYYYPDDGGLGSSALRLYDYGSLKVYSYHYSNWNTIREELNRNDASAKLNNEIKKILVNGCLSDVTTYAGDKGPDIRSKLLESLSIINKRIDKTENVIVISSSLGSKVLADSLLLDSKYSISNSLEDGSEGESEIKRTDDYRLESKSLLMKTKTIFMASNQLALLYPLSLDTDKIDSRFSSPNHNEEMMQNPLVYAVSSVLSEPEIFDKKTDEGLMSIVAFNDPNDLLSYPVPEEVLTPKEPDNDVNFNLYNIYVSNDWTWFKLFTNPVKTHTAYLENDDVIELISCGTAGC